MLQQAAMLLLTAMACAQASKPVERVEMIGPVFHQLVSFNLPETFNSAAPEHASRDFYLHEIPRVGETVDHWTQLVTLNGFRDALAKGVTSKSAIENIANHFEQHCSSSFAGGRIGATTLSGRTAYVLIASCGSVADQGGRPGAVHSETALLIGIEGDQDIYTLQWAERGPASATPIAIDEAKWKARFRVLSPIRVCTPVPGEKEPYPSCLKS